MFATLDDSNKYLSGKLNAEGWALLPASTGLLSGLVYSTNDGFFQGIGTKFQTEIESTDYLWANYSAYRIVKKISNLRIEIDKKETLDKRTLYTIDSADYVKQITLEIQKNKCLQTAYNQMRFSPAWKFPTIASEEMKIAQIEWAFWLFNGGENDAYEDRKNGIVSKQIDVLKWDYDKNKTPYPIPENIWNILKQYIDPNYSPITGQSGNFTFSF
ncbi:MAG: hypothetical protein L6Q54_11655 [Leptospiraceae bacterium]|nr:hypothetical protein [Leptospiraceae bacterium]